MMKLAAFSLLITLAITVGVAPVSSAPSPDLAPTASAPSTDVANAVLVPATLKPVESPDAVVIHVVNELKDAKKAMRVQCESEIEDLGIRDVPAGQELQWRIKDADKVHPFSCVVSGDDKDAVFKAYYGDAELSQRVEDNNSFWVAKDDGIYLRHISTKKDVLVTPWH